jgi:hypothetical protein
MNYNTVDCFDITEHKLYGFRDFNSQNLFLSELEKLQNLFIYFFLFTKFMLHKIKAVCDNMLIIFTVSSKIIDDVIIGYVGYSSPYAPNNYYSPANAYSFGGMCHYY